MKRLLGAVVAGLMLAGCGGKGKPNLTVSAAASLRAALLHYGRQFHQATVRFSFAGSDVLAAQIEQGVRPDVFASANLQLPRALYERGLVSKPQIFAANTLVLAVRAGGNKVKTLSDIEKPGVRLAIGSATVPIGSYTRAVLAKLGPATSRRILANVRSEEPDVGGIVGKLIEGAVDAGFTYITDVRATHGALQAIQLPSRSQPVVAYGVAIVTGTHHSAEARRFIVGLINGEGRADLLAAGFLSPGQG
jgi:molybdate transport system substrate-binding protein